MVDRFSIRKPSSQNPAESVDLRARGDFNLNECFIDGTFVVAKKRDSERKRPSGAKGRSSWRWPHGAGLPLAVHTTSDSPHEVSLVTDTLLESFVDEFPERLLVDKAFDSDPLDKELTAAGIEMIAPHRGGRKKPATQGGRSLRRFRRRHKAERLFAWQHNFRRLVVCYEYYQENFLGFVHIGCILILLRSYL
jgi:transposase